MRIQLTDGQRVYYEYNDATGKVFYSNSILHIHWAVQSTLEKIKTMFTGTPGHLQLHKAFVKYADAWHPKLFWKYVEHMQ